MHFFLRKKIDGKASSISDIAEHYRIKGNTLYKQYKEHISDFESYKKTHAKSFKHQSFVFPENFGNRMGIDETGLFNGELYTVLVNKDRRGKKGSLAAIIKGTASQAVVPAISNAVTIERLMNINEITLDMANSMDWIVRQIAPNATKTYDRFHVEKLVYEALQDIRVRYRWQAMEQEAETKRISILPNGDTQKQLLARSRYLLFKQSIFWTPEQSKRAGILFREYPEIRKAYYLTMDFKRAFSLPYNEAKKHIEQWCEDVTKSSLKEFSTVAKTIKNHIQGIINFLLNKETNASVENFNAKIKDFFHRLRGVNDTDLFFYRLFMLYA